MNRLFKFLLLFGTLLPLSFNTSARVRYHCPEDSARVMELLGKAAQGDTFQQRIVAAAKALEGTPFAPAADNDSIGTIVVRLDSLNQREFIFTVLAAAKTAQLTAPKLNDFEQNLENISRRKGVDEGFPSQFFYASDWIVDNVYRGNLKDMTEYVTGGDSKVKTLDYVTRHSKEFPAMSNPEIADKVRIAEYGYKSHRIPHLKKQSIGNKNIKELLNDGDIIILNSPEVDFDMYDIGFVTMENGEPYLIHISKETNLAGIDPYPISRLFKILNQFFYGYRWIRPLE